MRRNKTNRFFTTGILFLFAVFLTGSFVCASELDEIKDAIKKQGKKWIADETSVSKLPEHERKLRLGLFKHTPPTGEETVLPLQESLAVLPTGLDWRGYVTAVRDQGNCGSCWAFATTAALESYILIKNKDSSKNENRAEEILLSCSKAGSCSGGYIDRASDYIRGTGLPPETFFPYTDSSRDDACRNALPGWNTMTSKIGAWSWVTTNPASVDAIKNALATYGPLVTTMDVYTDFFSYKTGTYEYSWGKYEGGHAILIVGYAEGGSGAGYFIVKNSWGELWGDLGYFNIAYSQIGSPVYFGEWTIAYQQPGPPPSAPSNLVATALPSTRIALSWTDNSNNENGFKIERCAGAGCGNFAQIATVGTGVVNYTNTGLRAGTAYNYRVRAYNAGGDSDYSNTATATARR